MVFENCKRAWIKGKPKEKPKERRIKRMEKMEIETDTLRI
jgi:hypothetical protein